jgi:hypothetical protein
MTELARKTTPETKPIQCKMPRERPTTRPARCRDGKTEKADWATTGKKTKPPSHTTRDRNMRNRRKGMADIMQQKRDELRTEN